MTAVGICRANPQCARAYWAAYRRSPRLEPRMCGACGLPIMTDNQTGICRRRTCVAAYFAAYRSKSVSEQCELLRK